MSVAILNSYFGSSAPSVAGFSSSCSGAMHHQTENPNIRHKRNRPPKRRYGWLWERKDFGNELNPLDFRDEERKSSERLLGKPEKESESNEHRLSVISETCSDR